LKYIEKAILGVYYITWGKPAKKLQRGRKLNGKGDRLQKGTLAARTHRQQGVWHHTS